MKHYSLKIAYLLFFVLIVSCNKTTKYADIPTEYHALLDTAFSKTGKNKIEIEKALNNTPKEQKEGMAFLIAYMPEIDLQSLSANFLLTNCKYAYKVREEYDWCKNLPDSIFLNEVLPYRNINETADDWREDFYERFSKYVKDCENVREAFQKINVNIQDELQVEYNTKRNKADQSPYESMEINMASCTGLAILLNDALRSVGIPARVAGVPLWYDMSGNHNWSEIWIDGNWYSTEYGTTDSFDSLWFMLKAGKSDKNDRQRSVYAASYKPTGDSFPLVWDTLNTLGWVNGINVTDRYVEIAKKFIPEKERTDNEIMVKVWLLKDNKNGLVSDNRISEEITIFENNKQIEHGTTAHSNRDMNDYLYFYLDKRTKHTAKYKDVNGKMKSISFIPKDTLLLYY